MPILEDGSIVYNIPEDIKKLITYDFCKTFMHELHMVWGFSLEDFDYDSVGYCEGTGGWYEALVTTCRKQKADEVLKHYCHLSWYDSDLFDCELTSMLVANKLLLPESEADEIARQFGINSEEIGVCDECGKYYNKKDLIKRDEEDEDVCYSLYKCKKCESNENVQDLTFDKMRAIKEILEVTDDDFFVCECCGKMHFNFNKGEKYCLHCEVDAVSENKNANNYYRGNIDINEKYVRSLVPKRYDYKDYIAEVTYDTEDEIFVGHIVELNGEKFKDLVSFHTERYDDIRKQFEDAVEDYILFKKEIEEGKSAK